MLHFPETLLLYVWDHQVSFFFNEVLRTETKANIKVDKEIKIGICKTDTKV